MTRGTDNTMTKIKRQNDKRHRQYNDQNKKTK